jgi:hypothetical protein
MKIGYRLSSSPVFQAIQALTPEEFKELQERCEFNRANPTWKELGKRLVAHKVYATLVAKPA